MKPYFLFISLIFTFPVYFSQSKKGFIIPDSLKNKNYEQLQKAYDKVFRIDKGKAELYVNVILSKGKKEKNLLKTADAYMLLHRLKDDKSALSYLDSMIVISKRQNNKSYLSDGYMYKGNYFYEKGEFSKALSNYLTAKQYADRNSETYNILHFNIGLLKLELEEYQQAIKSFLDYKLYLEKNGFINRFDYLSCLYALAYTYSQMNQLDSSDYYVKLGLEKNIKINNQEIHSGFLMVSGINLYKRKKYNQSLTTLESALNLTKGKPYNAQNLALSEYYIGRILYDQNKGFLDRFEKVDSVITKTKNVTYELRNMYPLLIDYYKKTNNKNKQLFYIEHLLAVDSILNKNNHFLSNEISKKYDTPILLEEKENLISELNSKNYTLYWVLAIGGIIMIVLLFFYKKNKDKVKLYQDRADHLLIQLSESNNPIKTINNIISENVTIKKENTKLVIMSDEKLKQLSIELERFENDKLFLDNKLNLDILSKELNTNRAYLSKLINELKGQTFPQYLNDLRIKYVINELKTSKNLQKLTIAAIAEEVGFNNTESFTTAFKKNTGTLPSYFIKALQEKQS